MLHTETVTTSTLELLKRLMDDSLLTNFILVGGTSLSLQIGHRISVDLDLFSSEPFDESELSAYLTDKYGLETDFMASCTIKGEIGGVQIDCITHRYPWINKPTITDGIRLAGIADISAMKLNAIAGSGTRIKDFIDIAYLSSVLSLNDMLNAYEQKYNANQLIPLKALTYWEDINFNEPIKMMNAVPFKWKRIEKRILEMQSRPEMLFNPL